MASAKEVMKYGAIAGVGIIALRGYMAGTDGGGAAAAGDQVGDDIRGVTRFVGGIVEGVFDVASHARSEGPLQQRAPRDENIIALRTRQLDAVTATIGVTSFSELPASVNRVNAAKNQQRRRV